MVSRLLNSSFFVLCTICFINQYVAFGFTNMTDREALLAIKHLISRDPFEALSSWNNSLHFCSWRGVTCGPRHLRVTSLNLSSLQLAGSLSPHVGNLTFLRKINLSTNNFHGTIPQEVGRLFRLQYLSLDYNSFGGELPRNLSHCSNLGLVNMEKNSFTGQIPSQVTSLSNLYELHLNKNDFIGLVPPSFGNLSSLRFLSLADNILEGSVPFELEHLSKLEYLDLSSNNLSGMVPNQLYNISSLHTLGLVYNQFSGHLPFDLGLTLPNLEKIYLGKNQFSGPIPTTITNASKLEIIDLPFNALTGPVPKNLGFLKNLRHVNFASNPLGDENGTDITLLTSLTNCTNLKLIILFKTNLRGLLPNSITNFSTNLYWLALWGNYISGAIPAEIENLKNLQYLALAENMLTGRLPESIVKLSKLKQVFLYTNRISGKIPSAFGNISGLLILDLGENLFGGTIPDSLANCTHLEGLELTLNYLSGVIPEKVFDLSSLTRGLLLGSNELTGPLPSQVNMRNLVGLTVSRNKLSGEIPASLGNCLMLESLDMKGNFFEGTIPSSFKNLRSLRILDLSSNNLSGPIPEFLGELPLLENLNLSFNEFEGEMPTKGVFKNATAFSIAGNHKLCGGIKVIQLPACPKMRQQKRFPKRVVILVSSVALFILLLLACISTVIYRKRSPTRKSFLASPLEKKFQKVSYADLVHATDGFSSANKIGDGGYGTVYKGILKSYDQAVAVKVLKLQQQGANKIFLAECEALRHIRHRNLVRVFTACLTIDFKGNNFKALVFDLMPNGSLESWLHPSSVELQDSKRLSLLERINIVIDVASALDYLHNHCEKQIVHCDLKPSNILLDNDLTAHVGDFGLARILSGATGESLSTTTSSLFTRGTIGYVAPEYGLGGEVSILGDVYSYGILMLEIFTGKRPTDNMFSGSHNLRNFVKTALPDQVLEIADPQLTTVIQEVGESSIAGPTGSGGNMGMIGGCLISIFQLGVLCSADMPSERMVIADVLSELNKICNILHSH